MRFQNVLTALVRCVYDRVKTTWFIYLCIYLIYQHHSKTYNIWVHHWRPIHCCLRLDGLLREAVYTGKFISLYSYSSKWESKVYVDLYSASKRKRL